MCQNRSFYDRHISPRLVHAGCSVEEFSTMRPDDVVVERFSLPRMLLGMHYSLQAQMRRDHATGLVSEKREEEGAG